MNKHICVREAYDWIHIGNGKDKLSEGELEKLRKYLHEKKEDFKTAFIEEKYKKVRFINYVGIIAIENVVIEILPKISLSSSKEKDKEILLAMLSRCNKLPFSVDEEMNLNVKNYDLLDLIAKFFANSIEKEFRRGLHFEYIKKEDNLNTIKGKLLLSAHIKRNYANKVKAYCGYDEYSEDNFLNQVFKVACTIILRKISNDEIKKQMKRILFALAEVNLSFIDREKLIRYKFNRQNQRFKEAYAFAKLILLELSMENGIGDDSAFSMLFEMNTLFEEYIGNIVSQVWDSKDRCTLLQECSKYLLKNKDSGRGSFNLKPDIVLTNKIEDYEIIMDTKWKSFARKIESSDIYQMYAYVTRYEKAKRCILLYPYAVGEKDYKQWQLLDMFKDKGIEGRTIRLEELEHTVEDIKKILSVG